MTQDYLFPPKAISDLPQAIQVSLTDTLEANQNGTSRSITLAQVNDLAAAGTGPVGPAGGDLNGLYPNPTIKLSVFLSGNPTTTTQLTADNSTRIATTQFVKAQNYVPQTSLGAYLPLAGGTLTGQLGGTAASFSTNVLAPMLIATAVSNPQIMYVGTGNPTNQKQARLSMNTAGVMELTFRNDNDTLQSQVTFNRDASISALTYNATLVPGGGYQIGGLPALIRGTYVSLYDAKGIASLVLGYAGDASNFYRQTAHRFQLADGATDLLGLNVTEAHFYVPINGTSATFSGTFTTGSYNATTEASAYRIDGINVLTRPSYTIVHDSTGASALMLGYSSDPTNYYRQANHFFQDAGGANYVQFTSSQATVFTSALIGNTTRGAYFNVSSTNLQYLAVRFTDNNFALPLTLQNFGINGLNQGAGLMWEYGIDGVTPIQAGYVGLLTTANWSTVGTRSVKYVVTLSTAGNVGTVMEMTNTAVSFTGTISAPGVTLSGPLTGTTAIFSGAVFGAQPDNVADTLQLATTNWVRRAPGVKRLYMERISNGAINELQVDIPANAKQVELEWVMSAVDGVSRELTLRAEVGGVPVSSASYTTTFVSNTGTTPSVFQATSTTFWSLGAVAGSKGTLRFSIATPYSVLGDGTAWSSSPGNNFAISFGLGSSIASTTVTGFRLVFNGAPLIVSGAWLRVYVVT